MFKAIVTQTERQAPGRMSTGVAVAAHAVGGKTQA
jgi:hypothetical protein